MTRFSPDRRRLLAAAAAAAAGASSPCFALAQPRPVERRLVVVMLRGAVDGLSVVAPHADPLYYALRPDIALPRPGETGGLIDLDGRFGLHPSLAALAPAWRDGTLAFVHAAGSPDPTRSHFDAQDYLESGTPGRKSTSTGWLNRLAAALPAEPSPTRLINVGPVTPRILAGPVASASLAGPPGRLQPLERPRTAEAFTSLYATDPLGEPLRDGLAARREMRESLDAAGMDPNAAPGALSPRGFAQDAARLGALMRNDPKVQFGFAAVGGWDTHVNQGAAQGALATRLRQLGEGLAALSSSLGERRRDTVVVVLSEFGRTVRQNGNRGTDHGHGNVIWLLGPAVAGGRVGGRLEGLADTQLHEARDLPVTTDFRSVLGELCVGHLGLAPERLAQVFPQAPVPPAQPACLRG